MTSIRDVAKEAGVGVGTVSRALNGTGYVHLINSSLQKPVLTVTQCKTLGWSNHPRAAYILN